ncbi:low molecular weight protein-tyrosine-phosphatase [Novosphingobium sp. PASSN1]|uniref:low molecular weight protein-tyrosine-phosphatase n=1 Tax=Novosphingobium sp. PASSN1 TaxID=2015561 RepID=UPI000BDBD6F5|nr:low molecular weight protein-tyrosine-phosphatase [Novosphingobium sp. PASSN1]OYU34559.1 MAG: phosphotyrosine protein phosphatase [Novosphingobium sp. PASSN1]
MNQPSVLFVCLGNICRSPLAEAALRAEAIAAGLAISIDSAGTGGWHAGSPPDPRAIAEAERHGIDISHYRARQVQREDFQNFGHIYALDQQNLRDLRRIEPRRLLGRSPARLGLLMDLVPGRAGTAVIDPYGGTAEDFATTWDDVSAAARVIISRMT